MDKNNNNCVCNYVIDLTAQLDNDNLNQLFTQSLELVIINAGFEWQFPLVKDTKEIHHSAINTIQNNNQTEIEVMLGNQVVSTVKINKILSKDESKELQTLANVFVNQKRHISLSSIDQLTSVMNRHAFNDKIKFHCPPHENKNRRKSEFNKCLALIDIDHFKHVNDSFGHLVGDEVLSVLGQKMKQIFRDDDLCFRYGGEEFSIILIDVELSQAIKVLERFRKTIKSHQFPQVGQITVSIGVAQYQKFDQPTRLINKADKALYFAKENGRDKIISYQKLIDEGRIVADKENSGVEFI